MFVLDAALRLNLTGWVRNRWNGEVEVCADVTRNVFNPEHTDPRLSDALRSSYWSDLDSWLGESA